MTWTSISLAMFLVAGGFLVAAAPAASAHHCSGIPCTTTPKDAVVHIQWYIECTIDDLVGGEGCDTGGPDPGEPSSGP